MLHPEATTDHITERLATIKGWAADAEPATDSAGAAALRCIGDLCDVVERLTDRVLRLEADVAFLSEDSEPAIERAIRRHRDTEWHEAPR